MNVNDTNSKNSSSTPQLGMSTATSIVNQSNKRPLIDTSPETIAPEPTLSDLLAAMNIMNQRLINMPTKNDIDDVKMDIAEVKSGIGNITTEVQRLKEENKALKDEVKQLRRDRDADKKEVNRLIEQSKRKNVIFKGLEKKDNMKLAVETVCSEKLQINDAGVRAVRTIYERGGIVGVVAEMNSEDTVVTILKNTRKLAGTNISVERDLSDEKQLNKRALLLLRKNIMNYDPSLKISVRSDTLIIRNHRMYWSSNKVLLCGQQNAIEILREIYGRNAEKFCLAYYDLLEQATPKN